MNLLIRIATILTVSLVLFSAFDWTPPPPPPGPIAPFFNGVFPKTTPSSGGAWELEDILPGQTFYGPVRIIPFTGTNDILVLGKWGEIWRIDIEDQLAEVVLDIRDRS